jgi:two-component system, NtrC family, sensor histidine kinase HydH
MLGAVERIVAKALSQNGSESVAAEKRDLFSRLLGRLAHEIRNPLSSLDIHVQLLEEDLTPQQCEQQAARLEIIHGELHRLESIVEHFLQLAGPSALDLEPVETARIVTHVCELLRPEAAAREIEIVTRVGKGLPSTQADPVRLTQVLMNLVINAVQAIGRKGRVEVGAMQTGDSLVWTVLDNGPGIPAEKLTAIFEPYFTTKPEGHGLGLWIAQQIVTAHGGVLRAQNAPAPEHGAIFIITLPVRQ